MRRALVLLGLAACGSPAATDIDAPAGDDAAPPAIDAMPDASGFGDLAGMCGVLTTTDLTSSTPELVRATFTFGRAYVDPDDRPLLTPGGQVLAATPNAGGSSGLSEIFAYEELQRCEHAAFLKSETQIVYDTPGKITDLEIEVDGHKIGVSVTRAMTFPFGQPYPMATAMTLMNRKLGDIQLSTANVSAADRWDKQILSVLAWDDQAADTIATAWAALDASVKADTIVVVIPTHGADTFIYSNQ